MTNIRQRLQHIEKTLHQDHDVLLLDDGGRVRVSAWAHWDVIWAAGGFGDPPDVATITAIARSRRRLHEGDHYRWAREAAGLMLEPDWEPPVIGEYYDSAP